MSAQHHLNPSDYPDEVVNRLALAIAGILTQKGMWQERPMCAKEAMEFLSVGRDRFYKLENLGIIKPFKPDPDGHPFYYPSQMNEGIRKGIEEGVIRRK